VPERGAPTTKIGDVSAARGLIVVGDAIKPASSPVGSPALTSLPVTNSPVTSSHLTCPHVTRRRIPDFFIVGQAKSGTTALYEMLLGHPAIFMPDLKEPEFFASDLRRRFQPVMAGPLPDTLEEYLDLFTGAQPEQLVGEASAFYLSSHAAASSIVQHNPAARIVAVFREPASFLRSLHLQHLQNHNEDQRDLRRALALEGKRRAGRSIPRRSYRPQILQYSDHVRYTEQLTRYHDVFPREQVLVLIYDELRADNVATVNRIFRFLGVDDSVPVASVQANPTVALRSQALDEAVHSLSVGRGPGSRWAKAVVKTLLPRPARRRLLSTVQGRVVRSPAPLADEELMRELREWLKPEVERLAAYLDRDLVSLWGYGDV
jgi:hypothetical protein